MLAQPEPAGEARQELGEGGSVRLRATALRGVILDGGRGRRGVETESAAVRNWIDQGQLPAVRIGRRVRMTQSDFDRLVDESHRIVKCTNRPRRRQAVRRSGMAPRSPRPLSQRERRPSRSSSGLAYGRHVARRRGGDRRPVRERTRAPRSPIRPPGHPAPAQGWELALGQGAQQQSAAVVVRAARLALPAGRNDPSAPRRASRNSGRTPARSRQSVTTNSSRRRCLCLTHAELRRPGV